MQITIDITDANKITALGRATDSYNTINKTVLTTDQYLQLVTDQNLDAYVAVHSKPVLSKYEFMNRLTQAERIAIRAAAATNGELYDFMQMLDLSTQVDLTNTATQTDVTSLETAGLIAVGRAAVILAVL